MTISKAVSSQKSRRDGILLTVGATYGENTPPQPSPKWREKSGFKRNLFPSFGGVRGGFIVSGVDILSAR
jgi:hypothetical protein